MISTVGSSGVAGRVAVATGVTGLLATAFLALFFTVGQPFGSLNDSLIGIAAILSGVLAWTLYPLLRAQSPLWGILSLLLAWVGAAVVIAGSALVVTGTTGWFLAGLYMTVGYALIGLWLMTVAYQAFRNGVWPRGVAVLGLLVGAVMVIGLASEPGILQGIDNPGIASWYVNAGLGGTLGWVFLYPVWCIWLGRFLLSK